MKKTILFFLLAILFGNMFALADENIETEEEIQKKFIEWIADFKKKANKEHKIDNKILDKAFEKVQYKKEVIKLDRNQPEFKKVFWTYYNDAVHPLRVKRGKKKMKQYEKLLTKVSNKYSVPQNVLVAFWGMETDYGRQMGSSPIIQTLSTLSFDHRRSKFFTDQLIQALKILQDGKMELDNMKGSWAGAFGNFQFMPSTYMFYAVDGDGDGKIDVRGNISDAMHSAGNYLNKMGWVKKHRWGRPVKFDKDNDKIWVLVNSNKWKDLSYFSKLGITRVGGNKLPDVKIKAKLIAPMGKDGPVFLVYENFSVIMKWNNSTNYALSVGLLSDALNDNKIGQLEN